MVLVFNKGKGIMKIFLMFALISTSLHALETDQFIASKVVIKDSADILNNYFTAQIDKAVTQANEKNPGKIKCSELADNVMNNLVGAKYFGISKISLFAKKSPEIDKFPDLSVSDGDYAKMTFYGRYAAMLKFPPLARTINLNGIYMGTDKLGHFSLIGRNYYHNYLSFRKKGQNKEEAMRNAILKGFATERGLLGYGIGGVLSYGDLESNYEGMQFAIDICESDRPYVEFKNGRWEKMRDFDTKSYFNPRQDESFNFSFWRPWLYNGIKDKLTQEYCEVKNDPMYIERISKYPPIVENINDRLIKEVILPEARFNRALEDVKNLCN